MLESPLRPFSRPFISRYGCFERYLSKKSSVNPLRARAGRIATTIEAFNTFRGFPVSEVFILACTKKKKKNGTRLPRETNLHYVTLC